MTSALDVKPGFDRLSVTDAGISWLDSSTDFMDRMGAFVHAEQVPGLLPEEVFQDCQGLGGNASVVRVLGDAVIKISTPTTGRHDSGVENLGNQFAVMTALEERLRSRHAAGVIVPDQLLAVRTYAGNYIRAERYMAGWTSLYREILRQRLGDEEEVRINNVVAGRIRNTVGVTVARIGLNDLGLRAGENLHSRNILVREGSDNLAESEVCIIDQPQAGLRGLIAAHVLRRTRTSRSNTLER